MAFTAGAATVDITPVELTALNPIGGTSFAGVHDPIHVRALVLNDGATEVALISAELIECGDMRELRARIEAELGIPAAHVMITATHTHNAPRLGSVSPGALAHGGGAESAAYTGWVFDRILIALRTARDRARPARFGIGAGQAEINVNREVYAEGGWRLGYNLAGPTDPRVWVLRFESLTGDPIAVVANYAVHSTVALWTREVSGDLAGAAMRHVEEAIGGVALFTPGALGDQNPRVSLEGRYGGFGPHGRMPAEAERAFAYAAVDAQGLMLGAEVVRVAAGLGDLQPDARLRAVEEVVPCPVKKGRDVMASMRQAEVDRVDLRLSLILIGDVALAGVSGEVTTTVYRRLAARSPLARTILVSIANDRIGYLPADEAFDRPVHSVNGCPIVRGHAEPAIVDGLSRMIREAV
ncbi:neutral/alkaline non-lysosomal ceramidase N-terminal domain-containing protein [Actinoplanes sp. NPDC026619]|uniref:neutral/alkaline non-lysosomal ceramidase N-terminal domain-containing protein n=1 Tax=Actinoplanes sp. NPDC026619 TaxID=3155798 RepID=UPI0033E58291